MNQNYIFGKEKEKILLKHSGPFKDIHCGQCSSLFPLPPGSQVPEIYSVNEILCFKSVPKVGHNIYSDNENI